MAQMETLHEYNLGLIPDELHRNHGKIVAIAGLSAEFDPGTCQHVRNATYLATAFSNSTSSMPMQASVT